MILPEEKEEEQPELFDFFRTLSVHITDLFQNKYLGYFNTQKNSFQKFLLTFMLFSEDSTIFSKKFFGHENKKTDRKSSILMTFGFFFSAAPIS